MLVILPRPKFSFKWKLEIIDVPNQWKALVENGIVWTLAQEKRYRDRFVGLKVRFISKAYIAKLIKKVQEGEMDAQVIDGRFVVFASPSIDRRAELGEILCSSSVLYEIAEKENIPLFNFIIQAFIKATIPFLDIDKRQEQMVYRKVLSKFSMC